MRERLIYLVKYYAFWLGFFMLTKPLFMLVEHSSIGPFSFMDMLAVIWHGLPLDLSVSAYITAGFGLIMLIGVWITPKLTRWIHATYTTLIMGLVLWIIIGDLGTFPAWGFRLDKTVFIYLTSFHEVFACAPWWVWVLGVFGWIAALFGIIYIYHLWFVQLPPVQTGLWQRLGISLVILLSTGLLFFPMRGSLSVSTMNTGRVYYSSNQGLNLAAINPVFNMLESMSENTFAPQRYQYMPTDEVQAIMDQLLAHDDTAPTSFLRTPRPNIILCILESFSYNAYDAMPCLHEAAQEGVFLSNIYASSFRTDRGVLAAMSGFPGQPTSSLMTVPSKSAHLPGIGRSLSSLGYQLHFFYGGDEDFTNMRSYLISQGFLHRVSDKTFPLSERMSKWGVHDHILLKAAADSILSRSDSTPSLDVILTLSSHEPFEVPFHRYPDDIYRNSIAYTDSCLGVFLTQLKASDRWDNTLVIFLSDHGYPYPGSVQNHEPDRYHIPVVMTGGAIREPMHITRVGSQIDIVPTILAQMGVDIQPYRFGKNLMDSTTAQWALYTFVDGMGWITPSGATVCDAKSNQVILLTDTISHEREAKAMVCAVYSAIEGL